jgi:hypothetical protein
VPLEEEKPASVDTKPEAAQEDDAILIPVEESEEMTSITQKETMACQEMEERLEEEPTSVDRKPEVAQQREVPNEDAVVKAVKEGRGGIGARNQLQGDVESRRN